MTFPAPVSVQQQLGFVSENCCVFRKVFVILVLTVSLFEHSLADFRVSCSSASLSYDVTLVEDTRHDWQSARELCSNLQGRMTDLSRAEELSCVTSAFAERESLSNGTDGVSFWTGARFACPSVELRGDDVELSFGSCVERKSFVCEFEGEFQNS